MPFWCGLYRAMFLPTGINNLDNLFENHIPSPTSVMLKKRNLTLVKVVEEPQSAWQRGSISHCLCLGSKSKNSGWETLWETVVRPTECPLGCGILQGKSSLHLHQVSHGHKPSFTYGISLTKMTKEHQLLLYSVGGGVNPIKYWLLKEKEKSICREKMILSYNKDLYPVVIANIYWKLTICQILCTTLYMQDLI